jgi:type II secretory pathway pseudopilin PulG
MTSRAMLRATDATANHLINGDLMYRKTHGQTQPSTTQEGFAYVLLLIAVAVIGIVAGNSLSLGSLVSRHHAEQSLLAIGGEYEAALRSYSGIGAALNAPNSRGPRSLEDLLKDPRSPSIRRHLRQVYADPLTGKEEWGLVKDSAGFIVGIYSMAEGQPIKRSGFEARQAHFEDAPNYRAWIFGLPEAPRIAATSAAVSPINSSPFGGTATLNPR